jgi:hypothetical protein
MDPSSAAGLSDQLSQEVQQDQAQNLQKQADNTKIEHAFQTAKAAIQASSQG